MKKNYLSWGVVITSLLLSACGGGDSSSSGSEAVQQPEQEIKPLDMEGRLLLVNDDTERPELSLYDLSQEQVIHRVTLDHVPSAVYSSPNFRYGVLMDRTNGEVSFYDSGLSQQQGQQSPQLLNFKLYGAAPTHYRQFNGQAAVFYDGSETEKSKFEVFTDLDITAKTILRQSLPYKHHGVAEPRGEYVLSTYLPEGSTKVSIVKSYEQHNDHYHVRQTLENECPGLHGAASIQRYTAFGCEDGMLLVEQIDNGFKDIKLPTDVRISSVVGHEKARSLVGLSSASDDLYIVDAEAGQVQPFAWARAGVKRLKQGYSATGAYFVILDSTGILNVLDAKTWDTLHEITLPYTDAEQLKKAQLVMHGRLDQVFVSDILNKTILQIDLSTGQVKRTIQLDSVPVQITWLGY